MKDIVVIAFGAFDPLHAGHEFFLRQAKSFGDSLLVVVARDASIRHYKKRDPFQSEEDRLVTVASLPYVGTAILGNRTAHTYELLSELDFGVVALGYDQRPSDREVRSELNARGKHNAKIVRLPAHKPDIYKSTIIRKDKGQSGAVVTTEQVKQAILPVQDPELGFSLVELGLLYGVDVKEIGVVTVRMGLTTPFCPFQDTLRSGIVEAVTSLPGVNSVNVEFVLDPPWSPQKASKEIQQLFVLKGIPLTRF